MTGLEIARGYCEEFGKPMLENEFADILPLLAAGFVGSGSEHYGYDDENAETYLPVGDFIGDGTQFVLNKQTGNIAEWDHETGEVMEYGDFEDFLSGIMEFHCSDYKD